MVLDPVTTFFVYMTIACAIFAGAAAVADLWTAKVERDARRQARAAARAKRMIGERSSHADG